MAKEGKKEKKGKSLLRNILEDILVFAALALILSGVWWRYGAYTYTAGMLGGQPVKTQVFVNGELKGETPLKVRLPFGASTVRFVPPPGYRPTHESQEVFRLAPVGLSHHEVVFLRRYRVVLTAGQFSDFEVLDHLGKPVGHCRDAAFCELPLPGPGKYEATMKGRKGKNIYTGKSPLDVVNEVEEYRLDWH